MKIKTLLKSFSVASLIFLFVGIVLLVSTVKSTHLFQLLKPSHDFDYVLENGIKEGDHIKGEIYYSYGYFAKEETYTQKGNSRTPSKLSGYYYIIPAGDYGMAALYVRKSDASVMEKVTDETYAYIDGGSAPTSSLKVDAVAVKMEKKSASLLKMFREEIEEFGYTDADMEAFLACTDGTYLLLEGPADATVAYAFGGVSLLCFALAVFFFVRGYKKRKAWEAKRAEEWTQV